MEADCEALPSKARKRSAAAKVSNVTQDQETLRLGPRSFDEVMAWPDQVAADVLSFSPELHSSLRDRLNEDLVVTTHYSGIGCAETALAMLHDRLHLDTSNSKVLFYSACKCDPKARSMLLNYGCSGTLPGRSGPQHVFGDITSRVPIPVLEQLKQIEFESMEKAKSFSSLPAAEKKQATDACGQEMFASFCQLLGACEFAERDYCYKHQCKCKLQPDIPAGGQHGEITGTTCVAWSSMRQGQAVGAGWLHASTLPCLVWIFWTRKVQPDWFLHECVQNFDFRQLANALDEYCIFSFKTTPQQLGLPANRFRRFTVGYQGTKCVLSSEVVSAVSSDGLEDSEPPPELATMRGQLLAISRQEMQPGSAQDCENLLGVKPIQTLLQRKYAGMFTRKVRAGCEIYLVAGHRLVREHAEAAAVSRGMSATNVDVSAADADMMASLPGAHFQRLLGYRRLARESCDVQTVREFPYLVVNLQQTSGYHDRVSHVVPALLTKSMLVVMHAVVDSDSDRIDLSPRDTRPVLPLEHFAIMSFPIPLPQAAGRRLEEHAAWERFFPWSVDWLRQTFTDPDLRKFTGNGMHLHCLGSVLALLLSCYKPVRSQPRDDGSDAPTADSDDGLQQPPDEALVQPEACRERLRIL